LEIWIYPQILPYRILFSSACPSEERVHKIALFKRVPETTTYFWITTEKLEFAFKDENAELMFEDDLDLELGPVYMLSWVMP
jgi:hypothetical protein